MKFDIKISDLTLEELQKISGLLNRNAKPLTTTTTNMITQEVCDTQKESTTVESVKVMATSNIEELEKVLEQKEIVKKPEPFIRPSNPSIQNEAELSEYVRPLVKSIGLEKVRRVLAEFHAKTILDLDKTKYNAFIARLEELTKTPEVVIDMEDKAPWTF